VDDGRAKGDAMITFVRFLLVGGFNTVLGYGIILIALLGGAGDYAANAIGYVVGLPVSYFMHRFWTFEDRSPPRLSQAARFGIVALIAYGANVAVIFIARRLGYVESPIAQALAIVTYAGLYFLLSRRIVFTNPKVTNPPEN
jgi:putative flippase GtrA